MDHGLKTGDLVNVDHRLLDEQGIPRYVEFENPASIDWADDRGAAVSAKGGSQWYFKYGVRGFPKKMWEGELVEEDDPVERPKHYNTLGVECVEVIEELYGDDYFLGNAMKYLWRAKYKGKFVEDLKKCVWYIQRRIKKEEQNEAQG